MHDLNTTNRRRRWSRRRRHRPRRPAGRCGPAADQNAGKLNPIAQLDSLAVSEIPAQYHDDLPRVSTQLSSLNRLNDLQQLHQVTDMAAPVTGLLPGIEA